jgi:hypothetical protein
MSFNISIVLPCESSPCKNSGECENEDENTFKCNCSEGWIGETCEEEGIFFIHMLWLLSRKENRLKIHPLYICG